MKAPAAAQAYYTGGLTLISFSITGSLLKRRPEVTGKAEEA